MSFSHLSNYENDIIRLNSTINGEIPVPVLEMHPASGETALVAIIAHGFSGSKDLMSTFGTELARAGISTYIIDFPGHGQSPVPMNSANSNHDNLTALEQTITSIREQEIPPPTPTSLPSPATTPTEDTAATITPTPETTPVPEPPQAEERRIILIGHSMGAATISDYLRVHRTDEKNSDIVSTILVSPTTVAAMPTREFPRNLLILTGQNDFPSALHASSELYISACELSDQEEKEARPAECGDVENNTARRYVILGTVDHMTILNANTTFQEILSWLHRIAPKAVITSNMHADSRLLGLALGALSILLAIFPLVALLIDIFAIRATPRPTSGLELLLFFSALLIGIALALILQGLWQPLHFLQIALTSYITGYFLIIALVIGGAFLLFRRRLPIPSFQPLLPQVLVGVIPALLLYLTLGQLMTFGWHRVTFTAPRLLNFLLIAIFLFPLFLFIESIIRGYQSRRTPYALLADIGCKTLLIGGLYLVPWTGSAGYNYLGFLPVALPALILLFIMLTGTCIQLYANGRAALAGSIFSTLVFAWCLATTFPTIIPS